MESTDLDLVALGIVIGVAISVLFYLIIRTVFLADDVRDLQNKTKK